jgi:hypothetical protein
MTARQLRLAGFGLLTALFLALYWASCHAVHVHLGGDTTAFEAVAKTQLSWHDIFSTQRPPLYPLLFLVTGDSRPAVADVQFVAYVAAWVGLAWIMARAVPGWLGLAAIFSTYYVALIPQFAGWNHVLMSESLSISMSVGAFACLVAFLAGGGRAAFAGFVALMCTKCFLRDFDAFLCVFFIPVLAVFAWYRRLSWIEAAATAVLFLALFVFVSHTADTPGLEREWLARWHFAMLDNIGQRVLPDPRWLAFFKAHGMPVNDTLLSMTGRYAHEENWRFFKDPQLQGFRDWIDARGRGTYTSYLLHHPLFILVSLWRARDMVFQPFGFAAFYYDPAWHSVEPASLGMGMIYGIGMAGFVAFAALLALRAMPPHLHVMALTSMLMWLTVLPVALAVYHADAMEIIRHAIPVLLQAALSVLLMLLVVLRWGGWGSREARGAAA